MPRCPGRPGSETSEAFASPRRSRSSTMRSHLRQRRPSQRLPLRLGPPRARRAEPAVVEAPHLQSALRLRSLARERPPPPRRAEAFVWKASRASKTEVKERERNRELSARRSEVRTKPKPQRFQERFGRREPSEQSSEPGEVSTQPTTAAQPPQFSPPQPRTRTSWWAHGAHGKNPSA